MNTTRIEISNCRNLKKAAIELTEGALNVKYAPNGTGKSSLALGIEYAVDGDDALRDRVVPFDNRGMQDAPSFSAAGLENFSETIAFNEEYVDKFVF